MTLVRLAASAALLLSCFPLALPLRAQLVPARPDSLRATLPDTARSPRRDSLPGWPYLRNGIVPLAADQVPPGPLAPGSRQTFTRDSIAWSTAQTLSDLLGAIPGVYVARSGFLGLPEYVGFAGRGAAALRVYWDGMPYAPLGGDSAYVDAARIPLTYLRRVDVEVLPAELRVYLVSERQEALASRSLVRVMSGDYHTASYAGLFQQRWRSGLGVDVAANFVGTDGASGPNRHDQTFDAWGKVEWFPTATTGASYQFRRQQYDRDPVMEGKGGTVAGARIPPRHGARTDYLFAMFAASRPFGMGFRAEGGLSGSRWSNDSVVGDRQIRQAFVTLGFRDARLVAQATGRLADTRTTSAVEARLGWNPLPFVAVAADGALERHEGDRASRSAHASVALFHGPLSVVGEIAAADALQAPAIAADTAQRTADAALRIGFTTRPLSGHAGLVRRDAYQPLPFFELGVIPALGPTQRATYLVADARLQPIGALTLDGWYATPRGYGVGGAADFQPPSHGRAQLTFRSKFWRTFRSGAFDLKLQIAMESWSRGTAGVATGGAPIELPGTTYYETSIAFQIVGFTAFWDLRDAYNAQRQYVPGLNYPNNAQVFGVRWVFRN